MPRKEASSTLLRSIEKQVLREVFAELEHDAEAQGAPFNGGAIERDLKILYGRFERAVLETMVQELSALDENVGFNSQRYRQHLLARKIDERLELGVFEGKKER